MAMKNPPHPGQMIGDALEEMGVSVIAAAKGLGVTRQQLHNLIAGRCAITPEMAYRLEQARQLMAALRSRDPESIENEIEEARARGPTWRKRIDTALRYCREKPVHRDDPSHQR